MIDKYPFMLRPLSYSYSALEPYIDEKTMILHHDSNLKKYVDNLNNILKDYPEYQSWNLETILTNIPSMRSEIRQKVIDNAGGVYNHNLFFSLLEPHNKVGRKLEIQDAIVSNFSSVSNFYELFKKSALENFGSGYTFLVLNKNRKLQIVNTKNQDTVLSLNLCPILLLDTWEHAYYLKYNSSRSEYIDAFWSVINWEKVNELYISSFKNLED